jgi:beta-lactamase regulating signal transducer with metallopeptidase domain
MGFVFLKVFEMSIAALLLILAVVLLRFPLRRAPKWFMGVLWAIVALRLIVPVQVTAHVGFMPDFGNIVNACFGEKEEVAEPTAKFNGGFYEGVGYTKDVFDEDTKAADVAEEEQTNSFLPQSESSQGFPVFLPIIWLIGMLSVLSYAAFSYISIKKKTAASIRYITGDRVYVCDDIDTAFIFGLLKPTIYMPSGLDNKTIKNVLAHERAHIERFDHLRKQLGFLILAIHWFNPLVWIAYMLFCRDIELACDERVVSHMSLLQKKSYARSLLSCSTRRRVVLAYPLAFGEVGVGTRVKQIFNLRKPTAWLVAGLVVICGILSASSFTKAADKPVVAQIPLVELGDVEVAVEPETKVVVNDGAEKVVVDLESPEKRREYPDAETMAAPVITNTAGTEQVTVQVPKAGPEKAVVEVSDEDVRVEVTEDTVEVSFDEGDEEVTVSVDTEAVSPVMESGVENLGDVLGELDRAVSEDEVLNQVVNDAMEELVDEAYEEIADEIFDEIYDEGLGGLFGLFH